MQVAVGTLVQVGNTWRLIGREALVGICNGFVLGCITGLLVGFIFSRPELGVVIAGGMLANQSVAAIVGIVIPLVLDRLGADPAIASSIFVTAMTQVTDILQFQRRSNAQTQRRLQSQGRRSQLRKSRCIRPP